MPPQPLDFTAHQVTPASLELPHLFQGHLSQGGVWPTEKCGCLNQIATGLACWFCWAVPCAIHCSAWRQGVWWRPDGQKQSRRIWRQNVTQSGQRLGERFEIRSHTGVCGAMGARAWDGGTTGYKALGPGGAAWGEWDVGTQDRGLGRGLASLQAGGCRPALTVPCVLMVVLSLTFPPGDTWEYPQRNLPSWPCAGLAPGMGTDTVLPQGVPRLGEEAGTNRDQLPPRLC